MRGNETNCNCRIESSCEKDSWPEYDWISLYKNSFSCCGDKTLNNSILNS